MEKVFAVVLAIGILVFISFLMSWPVMILWNSCLITAVDGVHRIDWEQAWGISLLAGFLFKPTASPYSNK